MHLKLKLLSGRGAVVHRMELGDRCSSYVKLRETVSALTTEPLEPLDLYYVDNEQDVCKVTTDQELKASFDREARALDGVGAHGGEEPRRLIEAQADRASAAAQRGRAVRGATHAAAVDVVQLQ